MKKYVNDPDNPKTDSPCPVPRFLYNELADQLAKIHSILRRNLTPENKVKAIADTFANAETAEGLSSNTVDSDGLLAKCLICERQFGTDVKPFPDEKRICIDCYMKSDIAAIEKVLRNYNYQRIAMNENRTPSGAVVPCIDLLADRPFARYKHRDPDPGVCRIVTIDWENRRISMSNGCCRYFPSFDEVEIVPANKD